MAISSLPKHVGLIMDGNGRWAKKRLMPRTMGHNAGMNAMIELARHAKELGIKYLTVYTLSTENLISRPEDELEGIFNLLRKHFPAYVQKLYQNGARVKVIGDISSVPKDVKSILEEGEKNSPAKADFTLTFAINYGGRAEIVRAAQQLAKSGEQITEESLKKYMYTADLPDPDLIIRTGGEVRLSNFLMWQSAYSEMYFTPVLFPDFDCKEFDKALEEFSKRCRRFGGV